MEFTACLVGGLSLIGCGIALGWLRPPNWQSDGELAGNQQAAIEWWAKIQRFVRMLNNGMLILIGGLIVATAFIPHGRVWMLFWCGILVLLFGCILLAMLDAMSSLAGYKRALPEAARRTFGASDLAAASGETPLVGDANQSSGKG
ncbi:MAG: hypothetical protein AB8B50_00660 [Pirellulaceae bacterium]